MIAVGFSHHVVASSRLAEIARQAAPHLRPIFAAASEGLIAFGHAAQHGGPFRFPRGRPIVLLIADDMTLSYGPQAFDTSSLRRFLRSAGSAVIVSGAPDPRVYATALAGSLATGRNVAIIESQPRWEADWANLVRAAHPGIAVLISTPRPAGGVH